MSTTLKPRLTGPATVATKLTELETTYYTENIEEINTTLEEDTSHTTLVDIDFAVKSADAVSMD